MQKIENKFIYFILILIVFIIGFSIYKSLFIKGVDRNSYVELIKGEAYLNEATLELGNKKKISINDIIKTVKTDSIAIVEWGDGSVTRLGGDTQIIVNELFVSNNVERLNISFNLLGGKTWSNVISYLPEESYFKETFMDTEAAIRGTIFNVDLEKDYLYVLDHSVLLTKSNGETINVDEKMPISLSNFSFIKLDEFIKNIRDNGFDEINRKFDLELLNKLKLEIQSKLEYIISLSSEEIGNLPLSDKEELYNKLLISYQELNFVSSNEDAGLFDIKVLLKEKLLEVAPESEKKGLLNSFLYDFKDSINTKNYDSLDTILNILNNNTKYVDLKEEVLNYINNVNLGDNLKESLLNNLNIFKNTFGVKSSINKSDIIDKTLELENKAQDFLNDKINNLINN